MNEQFINNAPGTQSAQQVKIVHEDDKNITYQNPNSGRQIIISKKNENSLVTAQEAFEKENKVVNPEKTVAENITLDQPSKEELENKLYEVTKKEINKLEEIEIIRKQLGVDSVNTEETNKISREKQVLQEAITGINPKSNDKGPENVTEENRPDLVDILQKSDKEELDPKERIIKEFAEYWKASWGKSLVEDTGQIVKFSEDLASEDPEFKKILSEELFKYHKETDREFLFKYEDKLDPSGRLIKKDGTPSIYPFMDDGVRGLRGTVEYRNQALYEYARQKGLL
jgi:hypothetical protein